MNGGGILYLLDANVLIDAQRDYYPRERFPEFWDWLAHQGELGTVKCPVEILRKLIESGDYLAIWLKEHESDLLLEETLSVDRLREVVEQGYAKDLREDELERINEDAVLIAYAMVSPIDRRVVTTERSKPNKARANRHIPDVCKTLGVQWLHTFEMVGELGFTTKWDRQ